MGCLLTDVNKIEHASFYTPGMRLLCVTSVKKTPSLFLFATQAISMQILLLEFRKTKIKPTTDPSEVV